MIKKLVETIAANQDRASKLAAGSWWLDPKAFDGLGFTKRFSVAETAYLGGWSGHTKTHKSDILCVDADGVGLRAFKTLFTIPWEQITDIEVEGPEQAAKRVTATRVLALGVFALAAKKTSKSAVMMVHTRSGEEAVFQTEKLTAPEMRAKLTPILSQLRKSSTSTVASTSALASTVAAPALTPIVAPPAQASVADELKKLAELKVAGVLTDEEFASQKAKLLDL